MGRYDISRSWLDRAKRVMPCDGAQTLSKASTRNPADYPIYIDRGQGSQVWDVDGNQFTDYMAALGPIILGYNYGPVTDAVVEQVRKGVLFSLESPLVVTVAEMLTQMIPGADAVRFVKTGSAATSAAVRAARTYTDRELILVARGAYHGQDNWMQCLEPRGQHGVPLNERNNVELFDYNNSTSLRKAFKHASLSVAAVIIEPARDFVATPEFLRSARELCDQHGAMLIFDEVVTFARFPGLAAAAHFGVTPDLLCLGKALANGMPIGAVVGKRAIMDAFERCFISGTYNGELSALAAAKATLTILRDEPVVDHIWQQGRTLMAGFTAAMERYDVPGTADGIPPCWRQTFHGPYAAELKMAFMAACAERGILPGLITYVGYSHSDEDVQRTIEVYHEVAEVLAEFLETATTAVERTR